MDRRGQHGTAMALFTSRAGQPIDPATAAALAPLVERLALVQAIHEAWALIAALTALAIWALPFARPRPR